MKNIIKKYTNGEITVVWEPSKCIHSTLCFQGLPAVFDPRRRPWVEIGAANSSEIIAQIDKCPSGALSYKRNDETAAPAPVEAGTRVDVLPNGPLLVHGILKVKLKSGAEEIKEKTTAFCRCGASANKPYCDGSHSKCGFKDE